MSILKIEKQEYLAPDGTYAIVSLSIKLFGIPLYYNSFATENLSYLSYFDKERYDKLPEDDGKSDFYKTTSIGFKSDE